MPIGALVGVGFGVAISLVFGFRLLWVSVKARSLPELVLAIAFVFSGAVSTAFQIVAPLELGPAWLHENAFTVVRLAVDVGICCHMFFTWRVFRADARWAAVLFGSVALALVLIFLRYAALGVLADQTYRGPWFFVECGVHSLGLGWGAVEAYRYWRAMRRRLAVGLAEPVLTNRFFVWSVAVTGAMLAVLIPAVVEIAPFLDPEPGVIIALVMPPAIASMGGYALTFFPPGVYRQWITRRAQGLVGTTTPDGR